VPACLAEQQTRRGCLWRWAARASTHHSPCSLLCFALLPTPPKLPPLRFFKSFLRCSWPLLSVPERPTERPKRQRQRLTRQVSKRSVVRHDPVSRLTQNPVNHLKKSRHFLPHPASLNFITAADWPSRKVSTETSSLLR
jgi:hypothetical protein